jgi:hypothetical protein
VAAFARITGGDLVAEAGLDTADLGKSAWEGQFALLTHDPNAILNYANRFALDLWEMDWETLVRTPSRDTAPEEDRAARAVIMAAVERDGFTRSYTGRRVSRTGKLFLIENATVFTLTDEKGAGFGTGAFFKSVKYL